MNRGTFFSYHHAPRYGAIKPRMDSGASFEGKILAGPPCTRCGGATRIVAIKPHKRLRRRHVWTLECLKCGTEQTAEMPAPQFTH